MSAIDDLVDRRVVVVTGAASGMGRTLAWRWARRGARVAAVDLDDVRVETLVDDGGAAVGLTCDVRDPNEVAATVDVIEEKLGPVEILVNAAGIAPMGRIGEADIADHRRAMEVNYLGTVHMIDRTLPGMRARGEGHIINFASLAGWLPGPAGSAYVASKFAVVGFTECLASEVATTSIRVLCVCPPSVDTPLFDGIMQTGHIPQRAARLVKPLQPSAVIEAVERALPGQRLHLFPGPGTPSLIRLRRILPGVTARMMRILYGVD